MYPKEASRIILIQFISLILMIIAGAVFASREIAGSLGVGSGIALVANLCFYRSVFKYKGALQANAIVRSLYLGEVLKIILTFSLFLFVIRYMLWVLMLYLFVGYIVLQLTFWVVPLYFGMRTMYKKVEVAC